MSELVSVSKKELEDVLTQLNIVKEIIPQV